MELPHRIKAPLLSLKYRMAPKHNEGRIAIVGCGRSGTTYSSQLFKAYGYLIGHEDLLRHGISSWCIVPDTHRRCWGPSYRDIERLHIPQVHQVRHPLEAIASFSTAGARSWAFIEQFLPIGPDDSLILRCMKYWLYWNQLAEQRAALTYKVTDIEAVLPQIFEIAGFKQPASVPPEGSPATQVPRGVNRRDHRTLTWELLRQVNPDLTDAIRAQASDYGFAVR